MELANHAATFEKLNITVVVVSFCPDIETAQRWDREVGSPFLHVIDPASPGVPGDGGNAYLSWGFRKSFVGVWGPESLSFYSDKKLSGAETHPALGQDVHRMGGDIFLDGTGAVVLDHYSKTNTDRPLVEQTVLPLARALDAQRRARARDGVAPQGAPQVAKVQSSRVSSGSAWEDAWEKAKGQMEAAFSGMDDTLAALQKKRKAAGLVPEKVVAGVSVAPGGIAVPAKLIGG